MRLRFGQCEVVVPSQNIFRLLADEIFNPFYIF
jgi:cation-transporting ATPase 13A2